MNIARPGKPGRILGVTAVLYAMRLALALSAGIITAQVASDLVQGLSEHDRVLFQPGALYASEALRLWQRPLFAAAHGSIFTALAIAYAGLLPLAGSLHALATTSPLRLEEVVSTALRRFGALSLLLGATLAFQALVGGFFVLAAVASRSIAASFTNDRTADLVAVIVGIAGAAGLLTIGVGQDLARVRVVRDQDRILRAAIEAATTIAARPVAVLGAWAGRALSAVGIVVAGAWLSGAIGVARTGPTIAVAVVHQAAAFGLVFFRVSWLGTAVELIPPRSASPPDERGAGSPHARGDSSNAPDLRPDASSASPGQEPTAERNTIS